LSNQLKKEDIPELPQEKDHLFVRVSKLFNRELPEAHLDTDETKAVLAHISKYKPTKMECGLPKVILLVHDMWRLFFICFYFYFAPMIISVLSIAQMLYRQQEN
jgi:hypothetical protein